MCHEAVHLVTQLLPGSPRTSLHTSDGAEAVATGCIGCLPNRRQQLQSGCKGFPKSCSARCLLLLISTAAKVKKEGLFLTGFGVISTPQEGERWYGSAPMSSMFPYYVRPHSCVRVPSRPRGGERSRSLSPWPSRRAHSSSAKQ